MLKFPGPPIFIMAAKSKKHLKQGVFYFLPFWVLQFLPLPVVSPLFLAKNNYYDFLSAQYDQDLP
jgi:hypothetical protein